MILVRFMQHPLLYLKVTLTSTIHNDHTIIHIGGEVTLLTCDPIYPAVPNLLPEMSGCFSCRETVEHRAIHRELIDLDFPTDAMPAKLPHIGKVQITYRKVLVPTLVQ